MRLDSTRETAATFILGMLLATAVITAGQVGLPLGLGPLTPPGVWDSRKAVTVPFGLSEPQVDAPGESPPATRGVGAAEQPTAPDHGPALGLAARHGSGSPDAGTVASNPSSKGRGASLRDERKAPRRPDRKGDARGHGRGVHKAGDTNRGSTKRAEHGKSHGSPDRAVAQRSPRTAAAARHHDGQKVDHTRAARGKDKSRAAKGKSKRSHGLRRRST